MTKQPTRRTFITSAAAAAGLAAWHMGGFSSFIPSAHAAKTVPVGSLLPKTGLINIYDGVPR